MDYSEINTIRTQYQAGLWPQFLQMVQIGSLRGWSGQSVELNFPVVGIVGENGSGKSTLMKVAASVYDNKDKDKRFYPSAFFVETHWDKIEGVEIDFRVKRGPNVESFRIRKPSQRWRVPENGPKRDVFLLDIARTLPLVGRRIPATIESSVVFPQPLGPTSIVISPG